MDKKKTFIKRKENSNLVQEFMSFNAKNENNYNWIYDHMIEETEDSYIFKAYLEKTISKKTASGKKELEKIINDQKTPLTKLITNYEKNQKKDDKDKLHNAGIPKKIYRLND